MTVLVTGGLGAIGPWVLEALVERCVARGLSVVQGDADRDLADYPDKAFEYAILSQTLQTALQATYQTAANMMNLSLLDFIG